MWPLVLVGLVLLPLLAAGYMRLHRRRQRRLAAAFGAFGLAAGAGHSAMGRRLHIPRGLFLVALAILVVALARPQATLSLPRIQGTVILAFDVSGSMAGDDLKPTRLAAAKAAARAFVQHQPPFVKVGVAAFSDAGFTMQAPTDDQSLVLAAIKRLAPQRGTSVAHGIEAALNAIAVSTGQRALAVATTPAQAPTPVPHGTDTSSLIVLLSDGENNEQPDPLATARLAASHGIRIDTVGVGSTAGAILHIDGFSVESRLDATILRQIAQLTGGSYYTAANSAQLRDIYARLDPRLAIVPQQTEVTSLVAGAGIVVVLFGAALSLLWSGRVP
jgi:Ca-activated chloride channel family protein